MNLRLKALMLVTLCGMTVGIAEASAQQVALKTNLLYDATTTPNIGMEMGVGRKHSIQLYYALNPWTFGSGDDKKYIKHWMLAPEYRYWFCQRFNGSFIGIHGFGGEFDAANVKLPFGLYPGLENHRYDGWYIGGGVTYGYQWVLSRHWNLEAGIGFGVAYIKYGRYQCGVCGKKSGDGHKTYIGPTKGMLSLLYMF